jgi:hypothetical protein
LFSFATLLFYYFILVPYFEDSNLNNETNIFIKLLFIPIIIISYLNISNKYIYFRIVLIVAYFFELFLLYTGLHGRKKATLLDKKIDLYLSSLDFEGIIYYLIFVFLWLINIVGLLLFRPWAKWLNLLISCFIIIFCLGNSWHEYFAPEDYLYFILMLYIIYYSFFGINVKHKDI